MRNTVNYDHKYEKDADSILVVSAFHSIGGGNGRMNSNTAARRTDA